MKGAFVYYMPKEYEAIVSSLRSEHPDWSDDKIKESASRIFASIYHTNPQHAEELAKEGKWETWKKSHSKKSFDEDEIFTYTCDTELKEVGKDYYLDVYVSTPDLDLVNDIVPIETQEQIAIQLKNSPMANKVSLMHKRDDIPVGKVENAWVDKGRTRATVKLNKNHPLFNRIVTDIKNGFLDSSSIEYKATSWVNKMVNNTSVRVITGIKILGFALTGRPANPNAKINSFFCKSFDIVGDCDMEIEEKTVWTRAYINDLPDSAFAYIEAGGEKDKEGKTVPRSLRHLPYKDKEGKVDIAHLRNALSRLPQTDLSADAKAKARKKLYAAAKHTGVTVMSKKSFDMVIFVDDVELKEAEAQETVQNVASEPEASPKQEVEAKPEVQEKPEQEKVEETKPEPEKEVEKEPEPKVEKKPEISPKDIDELKKRIDALEAEKKVLIAKTEAFEKEAADSAKQELEAYKQNPSWDKAKEFSNQVSFRY